MNERDEQPLSALSKLGEAGYLVGGAVRDRLLGRRTDDYDVTVTGEPRAFAGRLARELRAHAFELSEGFGGWRVVARDRTWQVDVLPLRGGSIEADLAARDLTVNALAQPLSGSELIDPFGGVADLKAERLRMVSPTAFAADPLRVMRVARVACELGFSAEAATAEAARRAASGLRDVSPERIFAELKRVIVADQAVPGLDLLDWLGATEVILPELSALRGVEQSKYHHLDVHGHTREVLEATIAFARAPEPVFGELAGELDAVLSQPLADELTRWQALRFGALFHDIAKPQTRAVSPEGRTTFMGHDVRGAELASAILGRLRASQRLREHVAALTRHHLRLGFLVHHAPLSRRAIYRYLRICEPVEVDVTVLSLADRRATGGADSELAIARHEDLAQAMLADALRWRRARPRPPVRGDELARELGLPPGPHLGELLQQLEEAAYAGEIGSREQALARARELAHGRSAGDR